MLPTGEVRDLKMIRSSGNPLYDREVERAILKSRLPPPPDKALYESFRELTLSFRPRRED
jgi:colicin import membrane protein